MLASTIILTAALLPTPAQAAARYEIKDGRMTIYTADLSSTVTTSRTTASSRATTLDSGGTRFWSFSNGAKCDDGGTTHCTKEPDYGISRRGGYDTTTYKALALNGGYVYVAGQICQTYVTTTSGTYRDVVPKNPYEWVPERCDDCRAWVSWTGSSKTRFSSYDYEQVPWTASTTSLRKVQDAPDEIVLSSCVSSGSGVWQNSQNQVTLTGAFWAPGNRTLVIDGGTYQGAEEGVLC